LRAESCASQSDGWDTVDAQGFYRFGNKNKYMIALDVVNLFDEKYADYTDRLPFVNSITIFRISKPEGELLQLNWTFF
jgi:outer membrane receptor protein involved in Fe transport